MRSMPKIKPFDFSGACRIALTRRNRKITEATPPLHSVLYSKMRNDGPGPKTIIDYTRQAYAYPTGNAGIILEVK